MKLTQLAVQRDMAQYFAEDDLSRNLFYMKSLPEDKVSCDLYIKSDLVLAGLPWFQAAFHYLGETDFALNALDEYEGKRLSKGVKVELGSMPFAKALTGERIALNLLQRASNIATYTAQYVEKAQKYNITILDTRKTTPGLRMLEKYAVRIGGGKNHRFGQTDMWMVKDNHKTFFGGVEQAIQFFKDMGAFYNEIELEVHSEEEFDQALELGIGHIMLDNFSPELIKKIIPKKKENTTIEVSGGVRLSNLDDYLIEGVDAISVGAITYDAPAVDISFKFKRKE